MGVVIMHNYLTSYLYTIYMILFPFIHLGQYHKLYDFLDKHFDGDFRKYVGLDRNLFQEVLMRVSPRITKTRRCVYVILNF